MGKRHGRRKMKILFGCGKKTRKLFEKTRKMEEREDTGGEEKKLL